MTNHSPHKTPERVAPATLMLVLVCLLWGLSFPLMKNWQEAARECPGGKTLASFTLIGLRMVLALVVFSLAHPRLFAASNRREQGIGALVGSIFFIGFALQVAALAWTTPAVSAFITSLASAWVPLLGWLWWRHSLPGWTALGMGLAMAGTAVLGLGNEERHVWGLGEVLTLLSSVLFAVEILVLNHYGPQVNSAHITVPLLATASALAVLMGVTWAVTGAGLGAWLRWTAEMLQDLAVARDLLLMTVLSTVLAFHWMNVYQPKVSAARAALIYLLEPVFGAAFSLLWGHDALTGWLLLGGGLILGGNLLVEGPRLLASKRQDKASAGGER